jgi:hypothetical protein
MLRMSSGVRVWAEVTKNERATVARSKFIRIGKSCEILKSCPKAETGFQDFTGFTRRKKFDSKTRRGGVISAEVETLR